MYQNLRIQSELLMNYVPSAVQNSVPDPEVAVDVNGDTLIHVQESCMVQTEVQVASMTRIQRLRIHMKLVMCDVIGLNAVFLILEHM